MYVYIHINAAISLISYILKYLQIIIKICNLKLWEIPTIFEANIPSLLYTLIHALKYFLFYISYLHKYYLLLPVCFN